MIMSQRTMKVKKHFLRIFSLGPGFGESIIINIANRILLGIDSCAALNEPTENGKRFIDEVLKKLERNYYLVWVVTHYHHDHFHQLHEVLQRHSDKISGVIVPEDYTSKDQLQNMVNNVSERIGKAMAIRARKDYLSLRNTLERASYRIDRITNDLDIINVRITSEDQDSRQLVIRITGQSYSQSNKLRANGLEELLVNGSISASSKTANLGSYIVSLDYGDIKALLLGDAPSMVIRKMVGNHYTVAGPDFLKVSHHGAEDGTDAELLGLFGPRQSGKGKRTAVIAPYKGQRLPRENVVRQLKDNGFLVRICGEGTLRPELVTNIQLEFEDVVSGRVLSASNVADCVIKKLY
jgi:beta-lactamase superfamily II metal-dependent hydrolase